MVPERARSRSRRPARSRVGVALAFVSIGAAFLAFLGPSAPKPTVTASSALQFGNRHDAIEFARSKDHTLEPFLGTEGASASAAPVPVFSQRALR